MAATAMIDTIAFKLSAPLRTSLGIKGGQLAKGIKITLDSAKEGIRKVELNLPTLLFGHNGRLIESQSQIDEALQKACSILEIVATVPPMAAWKPSRVDMVWNFNHLAKPLILAFSTCRIPEIKSAANLFRQGAGVSWRGAKSHIKVTLYDKAKKMRVPGSILRAEVSLQGHRLRRACDAVNWRSFDHLYQVYRSILTSLPSISGPSRAGNLLEAIALEPLEIRTRILARLSHKPSRTFRRYQQVVEEAAADLPTPFSWANELPMDHPPRAIHAERVQRLSRHH